MNFSKMMLDDFARALASKQSVPGGGAASALAGALGACLSAMVGSLTVGKKSYADVEEEMTAARAQTIKLANRLFRLMDKDAEAFSALMAAYKLPKETEEEKAHRDAVVEECLVAAASAPLEIMEKCCEVIVLSDVFAEKGSRNAASDAGCSAALAGAALKAASLNVFINTKSMKNQEKANELFTKAENMIEKYLPLSEKVFADVRKRF